MNVNTNKKLNKNGSRDGRGMSPEQREAKRELALRMNAEVVDPSTGRRKFGGPQPGSGRPKKVSASELVAKEAERHKRQIVEVFKDAIDKKNGIQVRLNGAKAWLEIEQKERELDIDESRNLDVMTDEEIIAKIATSYANLVEAGTLEDVLNGARSSRREEILSEDIDDSDEIIEDEYDHD